MNSVSTCSLENFEKFFSQLVGVLRLLFCVIFQNIVLKLYITVSSLHVCGSFDSTEGSTKWFFFVLPDQADIWWLLLESINSTIYEIPKTKKGPLSAEYYISFVKFANFAYCLGIFVFFCECESTIFKAVAIWTCIPCVKLFTSSDFLKLNSAIARVFIPFLLPKLSHVLNSPWAVFLPLLTRPLLLRLG